MTPPPAPVRRNTSASWLGRAAVLSLASGIVLTAVQFTWPGSTPPWLGIGGLLFYLGVILVALWTTIRLFGIAVSLGARRPDDRDGQDDQDERP